MIDSITGTSVKRPNSAILEVEGGFCPLDALVMARLALPAIPSVLGTTLDGKNDLTIANQHNIAVTVDAHKMVMECDRYDAPFLHTLSAAVGGRVCTDGVWRTSDTDDARYKISEKRVGSSK